MASNPVPRNFNDDGLYNRWKNHDGAAEQHRRRQRLGIPDLCGRCERGCHAYRHGEAGCTQVLGQPPNDYLCKCTLPRSDQTRAILARLRAVSKT